jgi:hypothetical protein
MADLKAKYGNSNEAITVTINSLGCTGPSQGGHKCSN